MRLTPFEGKAGRRRRWGADRQERANPGIAYPSSRFTGCPTLPTGDPAPLVALLAEVGEEVQLQTGLQVNLLLVTLSMAFLAPLQEGPEVGWWIVATIHKQAEP